MFDRTRFDGQTEVAPCIVLGPDEAGRQQVERLDDPETVSPEEIVYWTIYLHRREGGVEAIADCPTEAIALWIAELIEVNWKED